MPKQSTIEAYAKLFNVSNSKAKSAVKAHIKQLNAFKKEAMKDSLDEDGFIEDDILQIDFDLEYGKWAHNVAQSAYRKNFETFVAGDRMRTTTDTVRDFQNYLYALAEEVDERGLVECDRDTINGADEWVKPSLIVKETPRNRIAAAKSVLYGADSAYSTKEAALMAVNGVNALCERMDELSYTQREASSIYAVTRLEAVRSKHAERGVLWKMFHPIDNYREKRAIKEMTQTINEHFKPEEIASAKEFIENNFADWHDWVKYGEDEIRYSEPEEPAIEQAQEKESEAPERESERDKESIVVQEAVDQAEEEAPAQEQTNEPIPQIQV